MSSGRGGLGHWFVTPGTRTNSKADSLLDAIDNIQTKVDLLKHCYDNKIKVPTSSFLSPITHSLFQLGILVHGGWRKM